MSKHIELVLIDKDTKEGTLHRDLGEVFKYMNEHKGNWLIMYVDVDYDEWKGYESIIENKS